MALPRYGVLIGTKLGYSRDPPDNFGKYYHGHIQVQAPLGVYECAVDVDSHKSNVGVEWRVQNLSSQGFAGISQLADGWHSLPSSATSGAMDYVRSPLLKRPAGCLFVQRPAAWLEALIARYFAQWNWKRGNSLEALGDLEAVLDGATRLFVFGDGFVSGLGVHDIHQNQGDPIGSGFEKDNAIWQDGITVAQKADGSLLAFLNKFSSQSYLTDDLGHPK